jgi:hypothetical protein
MRQLSKTHLLRFSEADKRRARQTRGIPGLKAREASEPGTRQTLAPRARPSTPRYFTRVRRRWMSTTSTMTKSAPATIRMRITLSIFRFLLSFVFQNSFEF